ncbi:MAG: type II CAAX endopeptidase family protein [Bacteroidota bacterium]
MIPADSPLRKTVLFDWFILCLALLVSFIVGALVLQTMLPLLGVGELSETMADFGPDSDKETISAVRIIQLIGQFFMFLFPAILFVSFLYAYKPLGYLHLNKNIKWQNIFLGTVLIIGAFPFSQFLFWLNQQLPLPAYFTEVEESAALITQGLLKMDTPGELLMNLLVIAVLPALGEEFLFRGILQNLFAKMGMKVHALIWTAAFLFSAMHMQFAGFLPRFFLGAILGYMVYWTGSLWVPIIAHFFNNACQVFAQYLYAKEVSDLDLEKIDGVPWYVTIISALIIISISSILIKSNRDIQIDYSKERIEPEIKKHVDQDIEEE